LPKTLLFWNKTLLFRRKMKVFQAKHCCSGAKQNVFESIHFIFAQKTRANFIQINFILAGNDWHKPQRNVPVQDTSVQK